MSNKRGAKVRKQTVLDSYTSKYPCIVKKSDHTVFCTICKSTFSMGHLGSFDIKIHIASTKHAGFVKDAETCRTLDKMGFSAIPKAPKV